jgi:ribosome-associated toxin RatA of RatAB toxin-antitoxin module
MHSALTIEMAARPETVFALARDVGRWSALLPHYRRSAVMARNGERVLAQFVAVRRFGSLPMPVTWRAICWSDATDGADLQLHFLHVRGVTRGMRVTWHIRPLPVEPARTRVTIEHDFRRPLPFARPDALPALVDRLFTVPIATRTLERFRALAEGDEVTRHPSDPSRTNPST